MATDIDLKSAVKEGVLEGMGAANDHDDLIKFHNEANGIETPEEAVQSRLNSVIENQRSIIELFRTYNERTSGVESSGEPIGQSGFAQQATASSQNGMSLGSGLSTGSFMGTPGSIRTYIVNHGVVVADGAGIVQGGSSDIGAAETSVPAASRDDSDRVSYKAGIGDATERENAARFDQEKRNYQEYTMKPTMSKLSQALGKYLEQQSGVDNGSGMFDFLGKGLGALIGGLGGLAIGWISGLKTQWMNVGRSFVKTFNSAVGWLKDTKLAKSMSDLGKTFKGVVSGMKDAIVGKFRGLANTVESSLGKVKTSFVKTLSGWKSAISDSVIGKAAVAVKDGVGKIMGGVTKAVKTAASAVAHSPIVKAGATAGKFAMGIGKRLPVVQGAVGLADAAKNTYDVFKKGGNIKDIMSTGLAGTTDALVNTLAVPEIIGAVKGAVRGARKDGLSGMFKGAGAGIMNAHDPNKVSIGQAFASEVAHWSGNETETTRRMRTANMYGLTKSEVGLSNINGNAGGFGTAASLYTGDRKLAAGSTENMNMPNASTGDEVSVKRMSDEERIKETADLFKVSFIEALTSDEVKRANSEQAKAAGEAINTSLMG